MTSPHVLHRLPLWVEGDLAEPERAVIEDHLAQCSGCREAAERLKTSQTWLREATASPFEASDRNRLRRAVMDQIRTEAVAKPIRRLAVRPALLAACAASILLAILIWRQPGGLVQPPGSLPSPSPKASEPTPQPNPPALAVRRGATPAILHQARPTPREEPPTPTHEGPSRIEFQTSDPSIRIIWLAQATPLPHANPSPQEEP